MKEIGLKWHPPWICNVTGQWQIYIVKFWMRPPVQILSISCSFCENLAKSYVGAPRGVGVPSSEKSWIRHCWDM